MRTNIPFSHKVVQLAWPQTSNGGVTSDAISLKNAVRATIIVEMNQAVGHATAVAVRQATDVAAGTTAAGPTNTKAWLNEDVAATDTLVKQTDGASVTVTNDVKKKQIVFEIDPAALDDGYDVVYLTVADSSQATNFVSATALIATSYQKATPPAAITD